MPTIDIEHLQTWVGSQETKVDDITLFPARALDAALDNTSILNKGDALPGFWEWMYFLATPKRVATGIDGHPNRGGFFPPVPLPRRMWAAGKQERFKDLIIGQEAKRISTIKSVDLKEGSTGNLVFVGVNHTFHQNNELCISQDQNIVYREDPAPDAPLPPIKQPPADPTWSVNKLADSVLLFRYSALTYNSHRIHYDKPYATTQEHYPGLVVHGPLLVTLLLNQARKELPETIIKQFKFRAVRPTFENKDFKVQGKLDGDQLSLWSVDHEGALCMQLDAELTS